VGLGLAAIAGPASATTNPPTTLLVLGDSLTWGANYFSKSQARLAAAKNFDVVLVDSRWGRRVSGLASTRYSGNAALKQLIADGVRPTAVIVALGTNDVAMFTKRREYVTLIQELMTTIGNVPVAWVNVHRIDSTNTTRQSQRFNAAIGQVLANYPLASVFDWAQIAKSNPKVVDPDKIHLTPLGHEVRTKVYLEIAATLAQRASDMTTTTTSTTTSTVPPTPTTVAP
jgi:lysophospholipase L1-like esterase